jgi:hypothetical protein
LKDDKLFAPEEDGFTAETYGGTEDRDDIDGTEDHSTGTVSVDDPTCHK